MRVLVEGGGSRAWIHKQKYATTYEAHTSFLIIAVLLTFVKQLMNYETSQYMVTIVTRTYNIALRCSDYIYKYKQI